MPAKITPTIMEMAWFVRIPQIPDEEEEKKEESKTRYKDKKKKRKYPELAVKRSIEVLGHVPPETDPADIRLPYKLEKAPGWVHVGKVMDLVASLQNNGPMNPCRDMSRAIINETNEEKK